MYIRDGRENESFRMSVYVFVILISLNASQFLFLCRAGWEVSLAKSSPKWVHCQLCESLVTIILVSFFQNFLPKRSRIKFIIWTPLKIMSTIHKMRRMYFLSSDNIVGVGVRCEVVTGLFSVIVLVDVIYIFIFKL